MKCLILAAGYATRLYPLTENFPKPLLKVAGKPILNHLIDDLEATAAVDEYIVVTNHKFAPIFEEWAGEISPRGPMGLGRDDSGDGTIKGLGRDDKGDGASDGLGRDDSVEGTARAGRRRPAIRIVDDGTSSNETRLGAVCDIQYAIGQCGIDDDLLVMAGDNLLSFSLKDFVDYFRAKGTTCIMRYWESDEKRLRKSGIAEVDAEGRILSMEEKPAEPKSNWCCPPFYIYRKEDVRLVAEGIAAGCGTDAPGSFIAWLCTRTTVHAFQMPGPRYDIGNLESYRAVHEIFDGKERE